MKHDILFVVDLALLPLRLFLGLIARTLDLYENRNK